MTLPKQLQNTIFITFPMWSRVLQATDPPKTLERLPLETESVPLTMMMDPPRSRLGQRSKVEILPTGQPSMPLVVSSGLLSLPSVSRLPRRVPDLCLGSSKMIPDDANDSGFLVETRVGSGFNATGNFSKKDPFDIIFRNLWQSQGQGCQRNCWWGGDHI
jgi:hypothetical protein